MNALRDAMRCLLTRMERSSDAATAQLAGRALELEAMHFMESRPRARAELASRFVAIVNTLVERGAFESARSAGPGSRH